MGKNQNKYKLELSAIKSLITLQKERVIVIKSCDKGGGIMVCNFEDTHLSSKTETGLSYYEALPEFSLKPMCKAIDSNLKIALQNGTIDKEEYNTMCTNDKGPGKFLSTFQSSQKSFISKSTTRETNCQWM